MNLRHTLTLTGLSLALAIGCNLSHQSGEDIDAGPSSSDAGPGVCCPITDWRGGCSPGAPQPGGGWAPSLGECSYEIDGFDIHFERTVDDHGCRVFRETSECCGCPPEPPPPPPVSPCEDLDELTCLSAPGCVPTYHDVCCSSCEPGAGCADCVDYQFWTCSTFEDACMAAYCFVASSWGCGGAEADCSSAFRTGSSSCSQPGCVPAVAADGYMEPLSPCVPFQASSCMASCFAAEPACPEGTTAEADGSCWTGRCIPASACGR